MNYSGGSLSACDRPFSRRQWNKSTSRFRTAETACTFAQAFRRRWLRLGDGDRIRHPDLRWKMVDSWIEIWIIQFWILQIPDAEIVPLSCGSTSAIWSQCEHRTWKDACKASLSMRQDGEFVSWFWDGEESSSATPRSISISYDILYVYTCNIINFHGGRAPLAYALARRLPTCEGSMPKSKARGFGDNRSPLWLSYIWQIWRVCLYSSLATSAVISNIHNLLFPQTYGEVWRDWR